eukprot:4314607-Prorocentrum_lima.AAC.1
MDKIPSTPKKAAHNLPSTPSTCCPWSPDPIAVEPTVCQALPPVPSFPLGLEANKGDSEEEQ